MDTLKQRLLAAAQGVQLGADGMGWSIDAELINEAAKMIEELERDNARLREELDDVKLHYGKVFTENENLRDENADGLLRIGDLNEALSPFALFASALDGFDPMKNVRTIGVQGIRVSAFLHAAEVLSLPNV